MEEKKTRLCVRTPTSELVPSLLPSSGTPELLRHVCSILSPIGAKTLAVVCNPLHILQSPTSLKSIFQHLGTHPLRPFMCSSVSCNSTNVQVQEHERGIPYGSQSKSSRVA